MGDREWILLNPGPANTTATVRAALVMPDLCHREPEDFDMMRRCRAEVTRLAGCGTDWTTGLFTGSGTAAGQAPLDFVAASANKCVQGVPGVSFVLARRSALEALRGRAPRSVYLDLHSHFATQEHDNTPFTPAVQVLHAMEQALAELAQEGLSRRVARYAENARVLREGLGRLGLEILVAPEGRSNILTTFRLPSGLAYDALHDALKHRGYVIYAGQGDLRTYAFRVANMGTLTPRDMAGEGRGLAPPIAAVGVPARAGALKVGGPDM